MSDTEAALLVFFGIVICGLLALIAATIATR